MPNIPLSPDEKKVTITVKMKFTRFVVEAGFTDVNDFLGQVNWENLIAAKKVKE